MVFLRLSRKFFPIKNIGLDSTGQLTFLHQNLFLRRPVALEGLKYQRVLKLSAFTYSTGLYSEESISSSKCKSISSTRKSKNDYSYAISYLVNSCGLSLERAISSSERVKFRTPERPNSVLTFLKDYGFSKNHIARLVRVCPKLILSRPERTLLPKLEFFQSIGASRTDLVRTFSRDPTLFTRSLRNQIIPSYNFLKGVLQSNEKVLAAMRRSLWIFSENYRKHLDPNITFLRELGVPESCIILLLAHFPEAILLKHDQFRETVMEVERMGFNPMKSTFVLAVHAMSGKSNKSIWVRCYETYEKWGWSKDDILLAFRRNPQCMTASQKKLSRAFDFLVIKMGWPSRIIARCPTVLSFSLEKRIIPRCRVIQELLSKGLIKYVSLSTFLLPSETCFLEKFVTKYKEELPQLLGVYKRKVIHIDPTDTEEMESWENNNGNTALL